MINSKTLFSSSALVAKFQKKFSRYYIEDPTYIKSIGSHVRITCYQFQYSQDNLFGSILSCKYHQKFIYQGDHLTHSCIRYYQK